MKYFTFLIPSSGKEYYDCVEETKKIIPDIEVWTSFPKNYPFKINDNELGFHICDKFRIWMLAYYYQDGAIWVDADAIVKKRYEIPENTIMVTVPFQDIGWIDSFGPGFSSLVTEQNKVIGPDTFPSKRSLLMFLDNIKKIQGNFNPIDLWAVGHHKRSDFFKQVVKWLQQSDNENTIFGIHKYFAENFKLNDMKFFPVGLFDHKYFSALGKQTHYDNVENFGKWEQRNSIEVDITYKCNLKCKYCNRFCDVAPSIDRLEVDKIEKFFENSHDWDFVRIVGGEPTTHPNLENILKYIKKRFPSAEIVLTTNGFGPSKSIAEHLGKEIGVTIECSNKTSPYQHNFVPMTIAPRDIEDLSLVDFSVGWKKCFISSFCGIGLTPYGFYQCGPAGAIDRIFGFNLGVDHIPTQSEKENMSNILCSLCAHVFSFFGSEFPRSEYILSKIAQFNKNNTYISPSWEKALSNYKESYNRQTEDYGQHLMNNFQLST